MCQWQLSQVLGVAGLSSQQREMLTKIRITHPSDNMCAFKTMMEGILKEKQGKVWKIKFRGDD